MKADIYEEGDWISPPGETVLDAIEERGWTQAELAERLGYSKKHVNLLVQGKAGITEETAVRLERVVGSTAGFWLTREAQYREALARRAEPAELEPFVPWLEELPVADMVEFGWVPKAPDPPRTVAACLRYFGVASVEAWRERYGAIAAAYRTSPAFAMKAGAVAAWLRRGETEAEGSAYPAFDKAKLRAAVPAFKALCAVAEPPVFLPRLSALCADCGVALVVAPTPRGCPASGATRMIGGYALLMLSFRYRSDDHFWFTFFHEVAHLVLHGTKPTFLEGLEPEGDGSSEREADAWAANALVPRTSAARLPGLAPTEEAIRDFAREAGVPPGIVVGRMQHDGILGWRTDLNRLKVRYAWDGPRGTPE